MLTNLPFLYDLCVSHSSIHPSFHLGLMLVQQLYTRTSLCRQPAVQRRGCDGGGVAAAPRPRPRPRPLQRAAAAAPPALLRARHGSAGGAVRHGQPGARRGIQVAILCWRIKLQSFSRVSNFEAIRY